MLIWGQWDHILYFWVSWCFCDAVAPDVQMRLSWKCWFDGNKSLFLIPESPDAFVTLLPLMFKWDIVGNVDLGLWDHVLYFWVSWCFCDAVAPDVQMGHCGKCWFEVWDHVLYFQVSWCFCDAVAPDVQMGHCGKCWFGVMRPCSLFLSLLMLLWRCCTWCSNETLWEMLIWGQLDHALYSWVSWVFCDFVAPDVQMRLCWKCWFEGIEYLFVIPESLDAFVTRLHLMFKWDFVGNVDVRAMSICS